MNGNINANGTNFPINNRNVEKENGENCDCWNQFKMLLRKIFIHRPKFILLLLLIIVLLLLTGAMMYIILMMPNKVEEAKVFEKLLSSLSYSSSPLFLQECQQMKKCPEPIIQERIIYRSYCPPSTSLSLVGNATISSTLPSSSSHSQNSPNPSVNADGIMTSGNAVNQMNPQRINYQDLIIFTIVDEPTITELVMKKTKGLVASLHRLRLGLDSHQVPNIHLFFYAHSKLTMQQREEMSYWNGVEVFSIQEYLGLPETATLNLDNLVDGTVLRNVIHSQLLKDHSHAIWIQFGMAFESPRRIMEAARKNQNTTEIRNSIIEGKKYVDLLIETLQKNGHVAAYAHYDLKEICLEGFSKDSIMMEVLNDRVKCIYGLAECSEIPVKLKKDPALIYGIGDHDTDSDGYCYIDIKELPVLNMILTNEASEVDMIPEMKTRLANPKIKKVGIAFPTISNPKDPVNHVFLRTLIPSFLQTVSGTEMTEFSFIFYVGFDHGDSIFDSEKGLNDLRNTLYKKLKDKPIKVKMIRLPKTGRVAMLWSILYARAMKDECDYFYQVNDDLTMVSSGWLTNFTRTLDSRDGFGVIGPYDPHNEIKCSILTMTMTTKRHWDIFDGMFYPTALKDWKTDRWLTHVYGKEATNCYREYEAKNGGNPTRYKHCEFLEWKIWVEDGKRKIKEWKIKHGINNESHENPPESLQQ